MAMPRMYVQAPPVTPLPFGLLSAATVVDDSAPHWQGGGTVMEPMGCGLVHETVAACYDEDPENPTPPKTEDDGWPVIEADPFVLYHLHTCRMPGGGVQAGVERAEASLRLGEARGIEAGWQRQMAANADLVNLTPGGAVSILDGLAMLEEHAAQQYGGVPVLHLPRGVTTRATHGGVVGRYGTRLETVQGSFVASGGGYTGEAGPSAAAAGEAWLYVTGQVVVRRGPVTSSGVVANRSNDNSFSALVERPVVVSTECVVAAVLVSTAGGINGGTP